ncbi:MAG: hypothetical protein E7337_04865 [Clostridiales bacterium]|nr:hypothetical protein [Clostridiales bacterium]
MKTFIALILAALLAIVPVMGETTVEEIVPEVYMIEGAVVQNDENGLLIATKDLGEVLVLSTEETILEGFETLSAGDYVYVDYSGMMSRSLPPQITAQVIRSYRMDGVVTEVIAEENLVIINNELQGNVIVHLPEVAEGEEAPALPQANDTVTVYFNGAMAMSLPPQIGAGLVVIHTAEEA